MPKLSYQIAERKHRRLVNSDVYSILANVPPGKVVTYGDIALALGCKGSSRAIGKILNMNPNPIVVPCHRVVMSDGHVGGYAYGKAKKIELLKQEGISFKGDMLSQFSECRLKLENILPRKEK